MTAKLKCWHFGLHLTGTDNHILPKHRIANSCGSLAVDHYFVRQIGQRLRNGTCCAHCVTTDSAAHSTLCSNGNVQYILNAFFILILQLKQWSRHRSEWPRIGQMTFATWQCASGHILHRFAYFANLCSGCPFCFDDWHFRGRKPTRSIPYLYGGE